MVTVDRLPILPLILYFIAYIVIHYFIGKKFEKIKEEANLKPGNSKLEKDCKKWKLIFKWFPAAYLIFIIFIMLT